MTEKAAGAVWDREREETPPELTVRTCKRPGCGRRYVWPKGSRRPKAWGPCCQPQLPGMER